MTRKMQSQKSPVILVSTGSLAVMSQTKYTGEPLDRRVPGAVAPFHPRHQPQRDAVLARVGLHCVSGVALDPHRGSVLHLAAAGDAVVAPHPASGILDRTADVEVELYNPVLNMRRQGARARSQSGKARARENVCVWACVGVCVCVCVCVQGALSAGARGCVGA